MSSDLFFYTSSDDEDEVNSELAAFTEACQAVYDASNPKVHRTRVERDHYGAHGRLVMAYFFSKTQYKRSNIPKIMDVTGHRSISGLMKCTSAVRQLAYGCVPDSLDKYLQMVRQQLVILSNLFIDCTHWPWANCPVAFRAQFSRSDHGPDPFILLEATASNDLWIWHAFFGVSGMNNDVNVLRLSPLFNDLKSGRAPDVLFVANNVPYKRGYYLTDGIYPQWFVLIKSIKNPGTNDHKRILYKTKHEAARKDVKRAFGVLKQKWKIIKYPARGLTQSRLSYIMYTCILLHNMIIHDNGNAISPDFFPEEQHRDDPVRTHAESMQVTQEIIDITGHLSLKADLVEHIWNNAN
ncbi:ALP1-like protein [Tanacetum coccineum]